MSAAPLIVAALLAAAPPPAPARWLLLSDVHLDPLASPAALPALIEQPAAGWARVLEAAPVEAPYGEDTPYPLWASALVTWLPMVFLLVMFYLFMRQTPLLADYRAVALRTVADATRLREAADAQAAPARRARAGRGRRSTRASRTHGRRA